MLVISRKVNEVVICTIPPSTETRTLEIKIVRTTGENVRLGLEAPADIGILRPNAIKREEQPCRSTK